MNKEELQNEINKTKEHLRNMEKMLEDCKYERWKPKDNEMFWYIDSFGFVNYTLFMSETESRFKNYNCFQTKEQAEAEFEKIIVRRKLEDIAKRLNKGKKINWTKDVNKRCLYCDHYDNNKIKLGIANAYQYQGVVYCLDENFKDIAIEEIGEERLKRYLKGE